MFKINYYILNENNKHSIKEIESFSDLELRYYFIIGNVSFENNKNSIDLNFGWIPILDFMYSLKILAENLSQNISFTEIYEFTENENRIFFKKEKNILTIELESTNICMSIPYKEFESEVFKKYNYFINEITNKHNYILKNKFYSKYLNSDL